MSEALVIAGAFAEPVRMRHALHGFTHVYTVNEEARHAAQGWQREDCGQASAQDVASPSTAPQTIEPAPPAPVKRRGWPKGKPRK